MLLEYSFRKSFLISSSPLKPDQHPIQQLLPPQIPSSSLVKTYSFSQLSNNNVGQSSSSNFIINNNNNSKRNLLHANNNSSNPSGNNSSNVINNDSSSFNEPYSEISLQLPTMSKTNILNRRIEQLQAKTQQMINQLQTEKQSNKELREQNKKLKQDYESLLKIHNLKQKDSFVKDEKKEFMKKISDYEQELTQLKKEIGQKNEQLTVYEMRSEESRRLLQKLNENINRKQAKLIKDKEIVTKQLQRVTMLLQQSKSRQRLKSEQLQSLQQRLTHAISQSVSTSRQISQLERNTIVVEYESKLQEKITQINQLMDRFTAIQNEHREEINRLRECLSQHQSNRTSMSEGLIKLQEDHAGKDQEIEKLEEENGELRMQVDRLRGELQALKQKYHSQQSTSRSRQSQLQLHLTNTQYLIKQSQQKLSFLQQQNQRINQLSNQLKQDKRMLQREKQQMKINLNEKGLIIDQLKSKLQQSREVEIKYKAIIENYEKEQERVYEKESEMATIIAAHEVRIKGQNIEIEKLNLLISQKQSDLNQSNLNTEKYKRLYQQQKLMLSMYKQQTIKSTKNTQIKWNELKHYYQTQIQLLQQKIKDLQTISISSNESRARIRNILQNSDVKAKIVTSRLLTGRNRHYDKEESYINQLNMLSTERENHYRSDSGIGEKKRGQQVQFKVDNDDNDEQLKENYWHGLNNDSIDHDNNDEQFNKN